MTRIKKTHVTEIHMDLNSIGDRIVHIHMEDKKSLARAMCRFQEYYESPFDDIRGKVFTLGQLKSKGSRANPRINTYCGNNIVDADWDGYNFPDKAIQPFVQGLFDPLTAEEAAIVEMLRYRDDRFYIIGTYGDDAVVDTMDHEVRHAMYGTCPEYKKEVDKELDKFEFALMPLKDCLKAWGYHESVIQDECHAYMGADHDYFFDHFSEYVEEYGIVEVPKLRDALNRIGDKYKKKLGINKHLTSKNK